MAPVQQIPVVPAARAVVDCAVGFVRGFCARRLELRGRGGEDARADCERVGFCPGAVGLGHFVNDVGEDKDGLFGGEDGALRRPLEVAGFRRFRVAPKAREVVRVDGVVNVHALHGHRAFGGDRDAWHAVVRFELHRDLRRRGHFERRAFEMLLEPQILRDGVLVRMPMIEVRRDAEAQARIRHVAPVPRHVVDVRVEVVRRRQPQRRAGDVRDVCVVGNTGQLHRCALCVAAIHEIARPAARWHNGFDPLVDPREIRRQLPAHGMSERTDARRVHLRLLFEKLDRPPRRHEHEEPIAVPR